MYCDVCGGTGGLHKHGCPEDCFTGKPGGVCCECGDGIYADEEYIENEDDEKMHYDCFCGLTSRELLHWLKVDIKRMREND